MASVSQYTSPTGKITYKTTVTRSREGLRETRSFPTRAKATAWGAMREKEIDVALAAGKPITKTKNAGVTLGHVIDKYIEESERAIGSTKAQVLRTIRNEYEISDKICEQITSPDLVEFAKQIGNRPNITSKSTVLNYMSHLQAVFDIAKPAWGYPLDLQEMKDAMKVCRKMGLTAKSDSRSRRPTLSELDLLISSFIATNIKRPNSCPMQKIIPFAIFSTRRLGEIVSITWKDYDKENKRILVRDMKHPGEKIGNDVYVNLPDPCCDIIDNMPKISKRIFPYSTDAITANFTRKCKFLQIDDLHFHDMRHEGISRLFETGLQIPDVAMVSGHTTWESLKRYTHIIKSGDKYEKWKWLDAATTKPKTELNPKKR